MTGRFSAKKKVRDRYRIDLSPLYVCDCSGLYENMFTGSIPEDIGRLSNLEILYVDVIDVYRTDKIFGCVNRNLFNQIFEMQIKFVT